MPQPAGASIKDTEFGSLHYVIWPVPDPLGGTACWSSSEHSLAAAARS
jgi:hypothetical protein